MSAHRPAAEDSIGDRLADWLDRLGLGEHLLAAGLPGYQRDAEGRARWTDPNTGDPMTLDQLSQLDRLLHSEGSEPEHAVPVSLVQVARRARIRAELLASPCFDYQGLAEVRGASVDATRFLVHKAAGSHLLILLRHGEQTLIPAFQLTSAGEPRLELAPMLAPLLSAGMDPWDLWSWLTRPAALLGGLVPHQAAADPETVALAHHAAVRLSERVAH